MILSLRRGTQRLQRALANGNLAAASSVCHYMHKISFCVLLLRAISCICLSAGSPALLMSCIGNVLHLDLLLNLSWLAVPSPGANEQQPKEGPALREPKVFVAFCKLL